MTAAEKEGDGAGGGIIGGGAADGAEEEEEAFGFRFVFFFFASAWIGRQRTREAGWRLMDGATLAADGRIMA